MSLSSELQVIEGDVLDVELLRRQDILAYELPATIVRPYGLASALWRAYPHAAIERTPLSYVNRAVGASRDFPGDVVVRPAPLPTNHMDSDPNEGSLPWYCRTHLDVRRGPPD